MCCPIGRTYMQAGTAPRHRSRHIPSVWLRQSGLSIHRPNGAIPEIPRGGPRKGASIPSQLNLRVPRLRSLQPCIPADDHGCTRRSRGTRVIKVDGILGRTRHRSPRRPRCPAANASGDKYCHRNSDFLTALSFVLIGTIPAFSGSPRKDGSFALAAPRGQRGQGNVARQVRQYFTGGRARRRHPQVPIFQPEGLLRPSLSG